MSQKNEEMTFDHYPTKEEIESSLFSCSENDPASINYRRKLAYHKINWWLVAFNIIWPSILIIGSCLLCYFFSNNLYATIFVPIAVLILIVLIFLKPLVIFFIKIYQRIAPVEIRNKCRFEPSCSEYMILAIQKYGLIKGLKKGVQRLKRCCPPNGGYDLP